MDNYVQGENYYFFYKLKSIRHKFDYQIKKTEGQARFPSKILNFCLAYNKSLNVRRVKSPDHFCSRRCFISFRKMVHVKR